MEIVYGRERPLVAASHENAADPGVWKKVLFQRADIQSGAVQMVNWARLPAGRSFAPHYHEDMEEAFIIVRGTARMVAGEQSAVLGPGDAVLVRVGEVHQMHSDDQQDVEYVVVGVSAGKGGRTIVVGDRSAG